MYPLTQFSSFAAAGAVALSMASIPARAINSPRTFGQSSLTAHSHDGPAASAL